MNFKKNLYMLLYIYITGYSTYVYPFYVGKFGKNLKNVIKREIYDYYDQQYQEEDSVCIAKNQVIKYKKDRLANVYRLKNFLEESLEIPNININLPYRHLILDKKSKITNNSKIYSDGIALDIFRIAQDKRHKSISTNHKRDILGIYLKALTKATTAYTKAKIYQGIAKICLRINFKAAEKILLEAIEICPTLTDLYVTIGDLYAFGFKDIDLAQSYYLKALKEYGSKPENKDLWPLRCLQKMYMDNRFFDKALACCDEGLKLCRLRKLDHEKAMFYNYKGKIHEVIAKEAIKEQEIINQNQAHSYYSIAYNLNKSFLKIINDNYVETSIKILSNLASSYQTLGDFQNSREILNIGLKYIEDNKKAIEQKTIISFYLSDTFFYKNHPEKSYNDETENIFKKHIKDCEGKYSYDIGELYLHYAMYLQDINKINKAIKVLLAGLEASDDLSPSNSIDLLICLAKIYLIQNNIVGCRDCKTKAINLSLKYNIYDKEQIISGIKI